MIYNPDGTRKINSGGAITSIYQVTLEADGNDDLIIGDDNYSLATFDREIPVVERGIHFISQGDDLDFNLDIYGNVVIPNLTMEPKAVISLYPTTTVSPILTRDNSPSPIVGSLWDNNGNEFRPEATIIPDIVNHLHLVAGNDQINAGAGEDTVIDKLFADDSFAIAPTLDTTTYERGDFWDYDFVDEEKSGRANFREYDLKLGNDTVDGGDGADLIQGDYSNIVTPIVSETASSNTEREVLQRNLELQLQDIKAFLRDLHQARYGIDYTQNDQSHSLIALNDTINGEGDDDVVVGENATIYLPIVEGEVDTNFDFNQEYLNTTDEAYNFNQALIHQHDFIYRRDNLGLTQMGEDDISGGEGNDILFGLRSIDEVSGNDGDDYVFRGAETDTLDGGDGTNVVRTTNPSPSDLSVIKLPIKSALINLLTNLKN